MKTYSYKDKPIEVHGVPFFEEKGILERLPESVRRAVPSLDGLGRRCPGARLCFRTNSPKITLKMTFETLHWDIGMSIYDCQAANVMIGEKIYLRDFIKTDSFDDETVNRLTSLLEEKTEELKIELEKRLSDENKKG